jgi:hypothetical protein
MTYEFAVASPKMVISNVKNSSDGTLNIPTVYTVGVSSFVSNSTGSRNNIYISDFSGALDIDGAAIWEPIEPQKATEGTIKESLETLAEKVGRLESVIGSLTNALGAVLNPAPLYGGQNVTGMVPVCSPDGQNMAAAVHIPSTANPDNTIDGIRTGRKYNRNSDRSDH